MNNEASKDSINPQGGSSRQDDQVFRDDAFSTFRETKDEFNVSSDSTTSEVLVQGSGFGFVPQFVDRFDRENTEQLPRSSSEPLPTSPATAKIAKPTARIKQAQLASSPSSRTTSSSPSRPRASTPLNQSLDSTLNTTFNNTFNNSVEMENLADQLNALNLGAVARPADSHVPEYLPPNEQIRKIHKIELVESEQQAHQTNQFMKLLEALNSENRAESLRTLSDQVKLEADAAKEKVANKKKRLENAERIVQYYKSSITRPVIIPPPEEYRKTFHRTSPKEIISLTGTFDPRNAQSDFAHIWSKLLGYAQANFFDESEYKNALRYILQGDAYDTFLSFEQSGQDLNAILDYFSKVYTPKRSLNAHRHAVDHFVRFKDESLEIAMHRCLVAIDKLRIQYPPESWPESRKWLRRNILTQIITDETRRYITQEEDNVMEKFGIPIDIEQLISLAHIFEMQHNKAPKTELTTLFQAASGGLSEDPLKMKSELNYLKKEALTEKNLKNTLVELLANPVMPRKFSSDKQRDSRRNSQEDDRHQKRQSRFDQFRQTSQERKPDSPVRQKPVQRPTPMDVSPPSPRGPPPQRFPRYQPPQPSTSYQQPQSRPPTPVLNFRNQPDFQTYQARSPSFDGRNTRYQSQDRYRDYRRQQADRRSDSQQRRPFNQQNSNNFRQNNNTRQNFSRNNSSDYNRQNFSRNNSADFNRSLSRDRRNPPPWRRERDQRSLSRENRPPYWQQQQQQQQQRNRFSSRDRNWDDRNRNRQAQDWRGDSRRDRDDRNSRERGRNQFREPSPYSEFRRQRNQSQEFRNQRSSSMTRYDDMAPSSKLVTVNINGVGFKDKVPEN